MLGLVIFSPLLALIALLIKLESPGPVFFMQKRVGKDDKPFEIIKFRSMTVPKPQEQRVETKSRTSSRSCSGPSGSKTAIGRALRVCRLDELPNLLNVLRGDLHLVGPRPDEPELVAQYRPEWRRRHDVKPGITGLAQIHGRTDLTYDEMMAYDLDYVDDHPFRARRGDHAADAGRGASAARAPDDALPHHRRGSLPSGHLASLSRRRIV